MALEEAGRNLQQLQVFRKLHMLVHEAPVVCIELFKALILDANVLNFYNSVAYRYHNCKQVHARLMVIYLSPEAMPSPWLLFPIG